MTDAMQTQLQAARRRLNARRWLGQLSWWVFGVLALVCVIVLLHRLGLYRWPLSWGLLGGIGLATAGVGSAISTWWSRRSTLDAAVELDRTFELQERISTWVSLSEADRNSPAGQALQRDVEERIPRLDIASHIPVQLPRRAWLSLTPLVGMILILWLAPPLQWTQQAQAHVDLKQQRQAIQDGSKKLGEKIVERKKAIEDAGIEDKDLEELTAKIDAATRELSQPKEMTAKDAALKLSDLSKQLEQKRQSLENNDLMKKALGNLAKLQDGPAQQLADALKQGDFGKAADKLEQIKKDLLNDQLKPEQKEKLAEQLKEIEKQLNDLADLKKREEQLRKDLPPEALKKELQRLAEDQKKMQQLKELAKQLGNCAKCAGAGAKDGQAQADNANLQEALDQAMNALEELRKDEKLAQQLDELVRDLQDCRQGMCQCDGDKLGNKPGQGMGRGRGMGDRPESANDTKSRETQVRTQIHKGDANIIGQTQGRAFKGESVLEIKELAADGAERANDDEAVQRQKVPREYSKHTQEYFKRLNGQLNQ